MEKDFKEETEFNKKLKIDFKYINLERFILKTILQGFVNWKTDMTNLFVANLSKFREDPLKLITAQ